MGDNTLSKLNALIGKSMKHKKLSDSYRQNHKIMFIALILFISLAVIISLFAINKMDERVRIIFVIVIFLSSGAMLNFYDYYIYKRYYHLKYSENYLILFRNITYLQKIGNDKFDDYLNNCGIMIEEGDRDELIDKMPSNLVYVHSDTKIESVEHVEYYL